MTTTSSHILRHTTAFISDVLSQSELRRRLIATLHRESSISNQITFKHLKLAADTLENAISVSSPTIRSSSLNLAEKLLLPLPQNSISSFLLSLIYTLCNRRVHAALSLLQIFQLNPSLARSEIAPNLYERLFSLHLLPVFRRFDEKRTQILPSTSGNSRRDNNNNNCDHSISDESSSVVLPSTKLLSRMSDDQASKLRELEREYEEVVDENCRIVAQYFKQVLVNDNGRDSSPSIITSPLLILKSSTEDGKREISNQEEMVKSEMPLLKNGRYNPIWSERETSIELSSSSFSSKSLTPPFYPQRVSPRILIHKMFSNELSMPACSNLGTEFESSLEENLPCFSSESECKENDENMELLEPRRSQNQKTMQTNFAESQGSPDYPMADYDTQPHGNGKHAPPKDFVCPITSNLFDDPVTLETGQTYERKAIEEWFNRGNSTCPITRQKLQNTQLPKTNYVLKRLIASWKEQNPNSIPSPSESLYAETEVAAKSTLPSSSPNSVITQANVDGMISELRHAINNLYMSEILEDSEMAVLQIEQWWKEINLGHIQSMLSKPPIINGFMEILFNSVNPQVLQATVFLLAEMGSRDDAVIKTLTQVDSDVECIMELFKKGLTEAVVLIYLLKPSIMSLAEMATVESLVTAFNKKEEDLLKMCIKPKTAAILLLAQILRSGEERIASSVANTLITEKVIGSIVGGIGAEWAEERIAAVEILLRCIQEDGTCRNTIAEKAELSPILESFIGATDAERFKIVQFFSELVKLNRRTFNEQILHIIKEEGAFSTMHTLLIYLQSALEDQCPVVAGLLLQLDLLVEPRKMSIYREEAMDTLISCIRNTDFPAAQVKAAEAIVSLQGRFNFIGKPLTRAVLLKRAGLDRVKMDRVSNFGEEFETTPEEEKAADDWERKIASVLVGHEFGLLFEALADGLKSRNAELSSACFVSATWLTHMLTVLPDTGIQGAARVCLLKRFVSILKSAKDTEDRILSMLALNSFLHFPDGLHDLTSYTKDVLKGLRELKRFSPLASEMLKVLVEDNESKTDIWMHKELIQVDCSENGEVLSVICHKDKIFSGHSDGTIKVWTVKGSLFHLTQETQEHMKAVTSLAISESGDRLYSGSLDRTAKVWSIGKTAIHCVQVHDMKDQIHNLVVTNSKFCYIPQGAGVKVHSWNGESRLLNSHKYVRCLALVHEKLYCGCHDNSIQEIDLETGTVSTIQSGIKKLLGKANPIHALQIRGELIYAACSSLEGAVIKTWSTSNYTMVGSVVTASDVRAMAMNSELIYLGCKGGAVEIWDRKKQNRIDTLQIGTNGKVACMAVDGNEEILVIGTSDGRIQVHLSEL
ncbi:putative E3 ubiquitin-protein ligase LIN-1 [Senna tora]|uniref:RING-type E3 ubiquitin transferase n=1 Tax=Senna tora TaxID=362788 RepID=A0A834TDI9_9FABA|nr:putative E3 ubiquitin-protein ligase LIN-1 [Senna tora]